MPTLWSRERGNYSWNGGDSWPEFIRVADGVDPVELNRRINEMLQKNLPDTESLQLVIDAAPLTDTYMSNDEVRRMDRIMLVLSLALLFITTLNYVLITIASLSKRAKSIGIHKCNGAGSPTIFSMFIIRNSHGARLRACAHGHPHTGVWRHDKGHYQHHAPKQMLEPSRLWVPISIMLIFVLIGGIIRDAYSAASCQQHIPSLQLAPQSVDAHAALRRVCRRHIHCVHDDRSRFAIS